MEDITIDEYKNLVAKRCSKKNFKVRGSRGVLEYYRFYKQIFPKNIKSHLRYGKYCNIIRSVNNRLREYIARGNDLLLPYGLGEIRIKKRENIIWKKNGKYKTTRSIDWDGTLTLWYNDKECRDNKILIRRDQPCIYSIKYSVAKSTFDNASFCELEINRFLKLKVKENINNKILIDSFL